jgi:SAM-dependent methyltransferase
MYLAMAADNYASGFMLDIGCGAKQYEALFGPYVRHHLGLDHLSSPHEHFGKIDVFGLGQALPFRANSFDTVLCTAVLEHLEEPLCALQEAYRVLGPGGYAIYTAPLFWHLHEEPRDFYRYTKYGLRYLFTEAGFEIMELQPLSGFIVTFAQELCYYLQRFHRRPIGWLVAGMQLLIQWTAYQLNRWDRSHGFTWMYLVVARKATAHSVDIEASEVL